MKVVINIVLTCGVYWTKFECISSKILTRATNRTRGARGDLKLPRTLRLEILYPVRKNQCHNSYRNQIIPAIYEE